MRWIAIKKLRISWKSIIFTLAGGICGFLYANYIGCITGTCPLTSNRFIATLFFSLFGYILSIDNKTKKEGKK